MNPFANARPIPAEAAQNALKHGGTALLMKEQGICSNGQRREPMPTRRPDVPDSPPEEGGVPSEGVPVCKPTVPARFWPQNPNYKRLGFNSNGTQTTGDASAELLEHHVPKSSV
eukprot:s1115_g6.t1